MLLSCNKNAGQKRDIKVPNIFLENVVEFKYLGMIVTNKNFIQEYEFKLEYTKI
jgi:hypothetical protein